MSKRMKSSIWSYFTRVTDQKASCDICKLSLSYKTSVSNLKRHIERKHPTVNINKHIENSSSVVQVTNVNDQIIESELQPTTSSSHLISEAGSSSQNLTIINSLAGTEKKELSNNPSQNELVTRVNYHSISCKNQQSISQFIPKKISVTQQKKLEQLLLRLFTKDFQPFSVVEDTGFVDLVKALNPGFVLPSRKVISQSLLPAAFEQCVNSVKVEMESVMSVCITVDLWTSVVNESYIAVTGHFLDHEFNLKNILLECSKVSNSHTGDNIATEIKRITDKFNISDKILLVVSDNASNVVKAITQLKWKHFGCYAHTLNLIVQASLKHVDTLKEKIRTIVSHFKRSTNANEKLIQFQLNEGKSVPLKLKQDVSTRWNSTFYMISRLCEIQNAVKSTVALIDKDLPVLTSEEWQICTELCKVLKPFEEVTRKLSGEKYITGSQIIVLTRGLSSVCFKLTKEVFHKEAKLVLNDLQTGLATRFHNIESSKTAALCTFLDPRFKLHYFTNTLAAEQIKKYAIELVTKEISDRKIKTSKHYKNDPQLDFEPKNTPDTLSVWAEFDEIIEKAKPSSSGESTSGAILEVRRYLEHEVLERNKDPLEWWRSNEFLYPNLSNIVRKRFNMVATSVPCEQVFSKTGQVISDRRTRLKSKKVEQLVFLNANSS